MSLSKSDEQDFTDKLVTREEVYHESGCLKETDGCQCDRSYWASLPNQPERIKRGKWMIFGDGNKNEAFDIWKKIKSLLASKQLGNDAKLSTSKENYVICVYTDNYEDVPDVFRVAIALWTNEMTRDCKNLKYKTDESSRRGCYVNEEEARRAGFDKNNVSDLSKGFRNIAMYYSRPPKVDKTGGIQEIVLHKNNVTPASVVVAKLQKRNEEDVITFYDPLHAREEKTSETNVETKFNKLSL